MVLTYISRLCDPVNIIKHCSHYGIDLYFQAGWPILPGPAHDLRLRSALCGEPGLRRQQRRDRCTCSRCVSFANCARFCIFVQQYGATEQALNTHILTCIKQNYSSMLKPKQIFVSEDMNILPKNFTCIFSMSPGISGIFWCILPTSYSMVFRISTWW